MMVLMMSMLEIADGSHGEHWSRLEVADGAHGEQARSS
jgi:hypothetical protein